MLDERSSGPRTGRTRTRPITCEECTIQIGEGFQESVPFEFIDDSAPRSRPMTVCWRCWESLNRRKAKRLEQAPH